MQIPSKIYYSYPDKQMNACQGMSPSGKGSWQFTPPKAFSFLPGNLRSMPWDELITTLNYFFHQNGVTPPKAFGEVHELTSPKRVYVRKNCVIYRVVFLDDKKLLNKNFRFEFNPSSISSFTRALDSAHSLQAALKQGLQVVTA